MSSPTTTATSPSGSGQETLTATHRDEPERKKSDDGQRTNLCDSMTKAAAPAPKFSLCSDPPNKPKTSTAKADRTLCGTVEQARFDARARRQHPQPWVVKKLMVPITAGLYVYAFYVYTAQFFVPSLRNEKARPSKTQAIGLFVGFVLLWLWTMWAYVVVVIRKEGYATDFIAKTEPPAPLPARSAAPDAITVEYAESSRVSESHRPEDQEGSRRASQRDVADETVAGPAYVDLEKQAGLSVPQTTTGQTTPIVTSLSPAASAASIPPPHIPPVSEIPQSKFPLHLNPQHLARTHLSPNNRYCQTCKIIKPYRAHHCRACGKCVLRFDHHCPWIGGCVGVRGHKFFINFNFSSTLFTVYTFITLIVFLTSSADSASQDPDPQQIVIIALAGLFSIFTASLFITHVWMTLKGMTTLEHLEVKSMTERIEAWGSTRPPQQQETGIRGWGKAAKASLRDWQQEWGKVDEEGWIWWDSARSDGAAVGGVPQNPAPSEVYYRNWVDIMGPSPLGWIFPIGGGQADGLNYVPRWRPG